MSDRPPNRMATVLLSTVLVFFVALIVFIVGATLREHDAPMFEPTLLAPLDTVLVAPLSDTITVDARDPERWMFFDFSRVAVVYPPDTAGWDLAFRRFKVIAAGSVADLGSTPFDEAPDASTEPYVGTTFGRDTVNAAIDRWYRYSFMTHLLTANDHVYAIKNTDGTRAKVHFLGYYCPGMEGGCVTFRFDFDPVRDTEGSP